MAICLLAFMSLLHLLAIEFLQAFCLGFMNGLQFFLGLGSWSPCVFFSQFCLASQMVATFGRVGLIHKFLESFCLVFAIWFGVGSHVLLKLAKCYKITPPLKWIPITKK
jgi:hypothetical protein